MVSPKERLAYIAFANSSASSALHADALELFLPAERSPLHYREPDRGTRTLDIRRCAGTYTRKSRRLTITPRGEALRVTVEPIPDDLQGAETYEHGAVTEFDAVPNGPRSAVTEVPGVFDGRTSLHFVQVDHTDRYQLVYMDGRLARRDAS